jgi:hypothetical protein
MILLTALSLGQQPPSVQPTPEAFLPPVATVRQMQPGMPPAAMPNGAGGAMPEAPQAEEPKPEDEPWALMRVLKGTTFGNRLDERGISISGWTQGNFTTSNSNRHGPVAFNDRGDFWQMNQNFLRIDKAIDTSKSEFQWGFRTEWILPGTDARFTPARGLLDRQTGDYRIDLFQAYGEAFLPNLGPQGTTVRVGKFATHVGYELVQGAESPFVSRSFLFQYNPFTHTGVWATTQLNDTWSVSNGVALGSDNFIDSANRLTYLGQLKWAPKEGKSSLALNAVVTNPRFDAGEAFAYYNVYNAVFTHNFSDSFTYAADLTFSHIDGVPGTGSATWYGAANYFIYKVNDQLTSTLRAEVFEDTKGFRTGFRGVYTELTYGVAYAPVRGVIFRPSVRYDHNNSTAAFGGKRDLFSATMDVILRW